MQPPELNYDIHDKELLAIIRTLEAFRHYLQGHPEPFEVWSDHNNLAYFRTKQKLSRRQARWSLFLSEYNFSIIHKPGAFKRPMLCPGVQTIKRGCFLRTTKPEPSSTASSLPSAPHKPNPMTLYCVNESRTPSPTIPKSAKH